MLEKIKAGNTVYPSISRLRSSDDTAKRSIHIKQIKKAPRAFRKGKARGAFAVTLLASVSQIAGRHRADARERAGLQCGDRIGCCIQLIIR